ncbi:MAG TPA: RIP metalloprotease RseP [Candidatus Acidoferrales bacterium]|nr:RIP metalloprotease RseP [Candidatus Acidoferrales bacterium]
MSDFLTMIVSVSIVLGIMVLVHEWGHFIVAKAFGVRVEVFSIGFGTRLWGVKRGDTDYRLSALPLGGYVKMAGDNPLEERKGDPDEFLSKPRWQRVLIALAGPAMNIVLSVLLVAGIYMYGSKQPAYLDKPMVLAGVLPDSTAQKAGLQAGDHVIKINSKNNPTWDEARLELLSSLPGHSLAMVVDRNGQQIPLSVPSGQSLEDIYGFPPDRLIVGSVSSGMPAERSGLKEGDEIQKVNGKDLASPAEFPALVQESQGRPMNLDVQRGDRTLQVEVRPQQVGVNNGVARWQIGIGIRGGDLVERRLSLFPAMVDSVSTNILMARQVAYVVVELFRGNISLKQLEGPLGIAKASGEAAKEGPATLFSLMAMIGVNLAVLNLLPIPPLDGGHILMLFIEGTIRRDLSVRVKERFVTVSMVFLLLVFAIVMYNDVVRLIPHH